MTTATKSKLLTYAEAVRLNLEHMGTPSHEWRAVKVTGMAETTGPTGSPVSMPVFDFPAGYTAAPTLYPQSGGLDGGNCELCNHPIKRAYHLQHDGNRWTLTVGSECVTHFAEGKNGAQVARQDIKEANRELIGELDRIRDELRELATYPQTHRTADGREWTTRAYANHTEEGRKAIRLWAGCQQRQGCRPNFGEWHTPRQYLKEIPTAKTAHTGEPVWTDRQIANWLKKHRPALEAYMAEVRETFPQIFATETT